VLKDICFALWFLLPGAFANVTPIFAAHLPVLKKWDAPIDGGMQYRNKELFGKHKTWRGVVTGMIASTIIFSLQQYGYAEYEWVRTISNGVDYESLPLILGPLFGLGALGGDALKSFFKRQRNIPSGKTWFPFDQLDYVLGSIVISLPFILLSLKYYLWMLLLWFLIHLLASYTGWLLHLKDDPI
jgi:CDP-2,3-bis-(O-geranylgeranyl)-sn-glycerol synthase